MLAAAAAAFAIAALAACVAPGKSESLGGRYVDPYTCEIKPPQSPPQYDPDCIQAAQRAAINAAKKATKGGQKK
jgi:hypothetical protein